MRYILTGKYANGDNYAEDFNSIVLLSHTLSWIAGHDHDGAPEHYRILSDTIKIETEEG